MVQVESKYKVSKVSVLFVYWYSYISVVKILAYILILLHVYIKLIQMG